MLNKLNIVTERVGFPGGSVGKEILGQENPLEKDIATHSSILPGKSHRQRSLVGHSPWGHKGSVDYSLLQTYLFKKCQE